MARRRTLLGDAVLVLRGDTKALERSMKRAKKIAIGTVKTIASVLAKIGKTLAIVTTGVVAASIASFAQLEKGVAEIQTLFGNMVEDAGRLRTQIKGTVSVLLSEFGQQTAAAIKGTYDAVSAGIMNIDLPGFMRDAAKLATAGATDIAQSVDLLTSILNAYGKEASEAQEVSDLLFTTVRLGKTTITELAGVMGRVAPIAASASIGLRDLFSAIATLTAQGLSSEESVTGLRGAITAMIKPTEGALKAAKRLGVDISATAIKAKGFAAVLQDIAKATGGSVEAMAKLFPEIRGMNAMLALTSAQGLKKFNDGMVQMGEAGGATQTAFETMADTIAFKFNQLRGALTNLGNTIGDVFSSAVKVFLDRMRESLGIQAQSLSEFFESRKQKIEGVLESIAKTAADTIDLVTTTYKDASEAVLKWLGNHEETIGNVMSAISGAAETTKTLVGEVFDIIFTRKPQLDDDLESTEGLSGRLLAAAERFNARMRKTNAKAVADFEKDTKKSETNIAKLSTRLTDFIKEALQKAEPLIRSFLGKFTSSGILLGEAVGEGIAKGIIRGLAQAISNPEFLSALANIGFKILRTIIPAGAFIDMLKAGFGFAAEGFQIATGSGGAGFAAGSTTNNSRTSIANNVTINGSGLSSDELQRSVVNALLQANRQGGVNFGATA